MKSKAISIKLPEFKIATLSLPTVHRLSSPIFPSLLFIILHWWHLYLYPPYDILETTNVNLLWLAMCHRRHILILVCFLVWSSFSLSDVFPNWETPRKGGFRHRKGYFYVVNASNIRQSCAKIKLGSLYIHTELTGKNTYQFLTEIRQI